MFGFRYCSTVSNGFAALFLSIRAFGLKDSNIVVPKISTCNAITNAVLASGNNPIFCDIDKEHFSLKVSDLERIASIADVGLIIAPSHFGIPAPISEYKHLGVPIIEDACQAFMTRTLIKSDADLILFSFYPTKHFKCIDGGAVLINDYFLKNRIDDLRYYDHQRTFDRVIRFNNRMPNLNAAIGLVLIDDYLEKERKALLGVKESYYSLAKESNILLPRQMADGIVPWRMMCRITQEIVKQIRSENIFHPDNELIDISESNYSTNELKICKGLYSIPYYYDLTFEDQQNIINRILK